MDFESLLRRYMRHVVEREGMAFTYALQSAFTEEEEAYLKQLGEEIESEASPPPSPSAEPMPMRTLAEVLNSPDGSKWLEASFRAQNRFVTAQQAMAAAMAPQVEAERQERLRNMNNIGGSPMGGSDAEQTQRALGIDSFTLLHGK